MDKKIGNFMRLISVVLFVCVPLVAAPSVSITVQNRDQEIVDKVELGVPFLAKVVVQDTDVTSAPTGLENIDGAQVQLYGTQTSTTIVNGNQTKKMTFTYAITPERKGTLELGPISVKGSDGTMLQADTVTVEVGDVAAPEHKGQPYILMVELSRKTAYVGQKVTVHVSFCYKKNCDELSVEMPNIAKVHIGYKQSEWQNTTKTLGGQQYTCKEIFFEMYPEQVGTLIIPSFQATFTPERTMSDMNLWTNVFGMLQAQVVHSHPCVLEVIPLPENQGQPVSAIGNFSKVHFTLKQSKGNVGEGVGATMTLEGEGNLEVARAPELVLPEGLSSYEGNSSVERLNDCKSRKTFQWVLQAQNPGQYHIPAQTYMFFDPEHERYVSLHSKPVELTIEGQAVTDLAQEDDEHEQVAEPVAPAKKQEQSHVVTSLQHQSHSSGVHVWMNSIVFVLLLILILIVGLLVAGWLMRPIILKQFWFQALQYRYVFWKYSRARNIQGVYKLFEYMTARYGLGLQNQQMKDCFEKLGLPEETFENWQNFVLMLLEFNFASNKTDEDVSLVFNLAKQWFPIILSCCKMQYKKS